MKNLEEMLNRINTKEQFDDLKVGDIFIKSNGRMTDGTFRVKKIKELKDTANQIYICYVGENGKESDVIEIYTMEFKKSKYWGDYWSLTEVPCTIKL
jgi:hypothetical protein